MAKEDENKQLQKKSENSIQLSAQKEIDLSGLTEEQIKELKMQHAKGHIDISHKAAELGVDTQALGAKLRTMADETKNIAESGGDVTIQNVSESSIGKTEVMMGTSDMAKRGKLSRTATGEKDYKLIYFGIVAAVIVVVAYFIFN